MIAPEIEARILRFYHAEKWRIGTIARQLGLHHTTVRRVLARCGTSRAATARRPSMLDPFVAFLERTLELYPRLTASRLYEMVRERGYAGRPDHFRHLVALQRPSPPAEAYLRLKTLPGEQAQADWASFGLVPVTGGSRRLSGFVLVLSWSRRIFLRFFYEQRIESFLRGHEAAFRAWDGVPRVILYDNLKSAVLERRGEAIRYHPTLLAFAGHYCYEPRPVAQGRGNEKGRVERAIAYVRQAFFAARQWRDLDELNAQAQAWCEGPACERRCPEEPSLSVGEAFEQERSKLLALPASPFATDECLPVAVGKQPYVRFDGNDYSVPHTQTRKTLLVVASAETVRIFSRQELLATHPRSYGRGQQIEDPEHVATLIAAKRHAREHRGLDRLAHAVPGSQQLLEQLGKRGAPLGSAVAALLRLLDHHGAAELAAAVAEALGRDAPHLHAVRLVLERRERQRGAPPKLPVTLPQDPRVRNLVVRPHELAGYDSLAAASAPILEPTEPDESTGEDTISETSDDDRQQ